MLLAGDLPNQPAHEDLSAYEGPGMLPFSFLNFAEAFTSKFQK